MNKIKKNSPWGFQTKKQGKQRRQEEGLTVYALSDKVSTGAPLHKKWRQCSANSMPTGFRFSLRQQYVEYDWLKIPFYGGNSVNNGSCSFTFLSSMMIFFHFLLPLIKSHLHFPTCRTVTRSLWFLPRLEKGP